MDEPRFTRDASDRLLDAHEVAVRLGLPVSWVYAQTRAGRIPTVRLGRYYRYRMTAIEAWIVELEHAGVAGTITPQRKWPGGAPTPPAVAQEE